MPTFSWSDLKKEAVYPEYSSAMGCVFRGEKIGVARVLHSAGTEVRPHASPHEQVHSILNGKARYRVGREERLVCPGEAVLISPDAEWAIQILEDLEMMAFQDVHPGTRAAHERGNQTAFITWESMKSDLITPRYSSARGPTLTGVRIEVSLMFMPAGTEGKPHSHPNEQIQVVLRGKARALIGGEEHLVTPGGGVLFPANVQHGAQIVEDYTVLNCKDIVPGWSVYHAKWEK
jgi:quercetin dioxygenase-like cupin family protein